MKKIIFTFLFCAFSLLNYSQTTVSGVVTYYFNQYQGNKPDLGASVTLIDSATIKNFDYNLYEKFHYGKFYQKMYFSALERYERYAEAYKKTEGKKKMVEQNETFKKGMNDAQKDMDRHTKQSISYESETPEKAAKISTNLYMQLTQLSDNLPKKTVDSNGNYSINAKPGVYYVLIKSKNRTSPYDILEISGKIYMTKIKISENDNKDVSYNFEI